MTILKSDKLTHSPPHIPSGTWALSLDLNTLNPSTPTPQHPLISCQRQGQVDKCYGFTHKGDVVPSVPFSWMG